jgi:hypothetical protein
MDMSVDVTSKPNGGRLTNAKRTVLIAKMFDALSNGYMSTYALSKQLKVNRVTIDSYRPLVDELIGKQKIERNVIRNLQLKRTYNIIEMLMDDLKRSTDDKVRHGYYNQIAKFSQHLALITGLNIETQVNVDQHQLVIIRANNNKKPTVNEQIIEVENVADIPTVSEDMPVNAKQGHTISVDK